MDTQAYPGEPEDRGLPSLGVAVRGGMLRDGDHDKLGIALGSGLRAAGAPLRVLHVRPAALVHLPDSRSGRSLHAPASCQGQLTAQHTGEGRGRAGVSAHTGGAV